MSFQQIYIKAILNYQFIDFADEQRYVLEVSNTAHTQLLLLLLL